MWRMRSTNILGSKVNNEIRLDLVANQMFSFTQTLPVIARHESMARVLNFSESTHALHQ